MFYKRDSATFKLLNCLDRISLMRYQKHLNDKFKKWIKSIKTTLVFNFPQKSKCKGQDKDVFSNIVELLLLLYYTYVNYTTCIPSMKPTLTRWEGLSI